MEDRIIELEIRFTEQQRMLEELSQVIVDQGRKIEVLEAELTLLKKKLQADPGLVDAAQVERPPHY